MRYTTRSRSLESTFGHGCVKCRTLYKHKRDGLRFVIFAYHLWEMELNVGADASSDTMRDWNGTRQTALSVTGSKVYVRSEERASSP